MDITCVDNNIREENFHHFPQEITIKKPANLNKSSKNNLDSRLSFGNRKKRIGVRAKSLQIIFDEGIIQSSH